MDESLNCPLCEKMDFKIIQSLLVDTGKPKNVQNLEDFSEEQWPVLLLTKHENSCGAFI